LDEHNLLELRFRQYNENGDQHLDAVATLAAL
jgi:hypothetical protein